MALAPCPCQRLAILCYRHQDQPNIVKKATVDYSKSPPEWTDIVSGAILNPDNIESLVCRPFDPLSYETVPQYIDVQYSRINAQRGARTTEWSGAEAIQPWTTSLQQIGRLPDPTWGLPRRYPTGPNLFIYQDNVIIQIHRGIPQAAAYEFEIKDFWYLFPASTIGQTIELQAQITDGNANMPTVYTNDGIASVGTWQEFQNPTIGTKVMQEYSPCLTSMGFTAMRMSLANTDFYFKGGANFRWRVLGDVDWIVASNPFCIPTLQRDTWEPMHPLPETFVVSRAKDGFGNAIDPGGNVVTGEECYDPPYATWPEPQIIQGN